MSTKLIKLELTEEEYEQAMIKAVEEGCANVQELIRHFLFDEPPAYPFEDLLWQVEESVNEKEPGERFRVRDLIFENNWNDLSLTVRRTLGRLVLYGVKGNIFAMVEDSKDSQGVQWYKKI